MRRGTTATLVLLLVASLLAGCLGGGPADDEAGEQVDAGADIPLADGTGAVDVAVVDSSGEPILSATVRIVGTGFEEQTNRSGKVRFLNVSTGDYTLRVEDVAYKPVNRSIAVDEGKITKLDVEMTAREGNVGAGSRPHPHDRWNGEQKIKVIDRKFRFHEAYAESGTGAQISPVRDVALHTARNFCRYSSGEPADYNREIWFDDANELVNPGTSNITVSISWSQEDFAGSDVYLTYQTALSDEWTVTDKIPNGGQISIPVNESTWDNGHQTFTLWRFVICTSKDPIPGEPVDPVDGAFDVDMTIHRGDGEIPLAPAHPDFFADGPIRNITSYKQGLGLGYDLGRNQYGYWTTSPDRIIPPDTKTVYVYLEWHHEIETFGTDPAGAGTQGGSELRGPMSMTYKSADRRDYAVQGPADMQGPPPVASSGTNENGSKYKVYRIPINKTQADGVYQNKSNWMFMWNFEGDEDRSFYITKCACDSEIRMKVYALQETGLTPAGMP